MRLQLENGCGPPPFLLFGAFSLHLLVSIRDIKAQRKEMQHCFGYSGKLEFLAYFL
jgi:hypothetical protein